MGLNTASKGLKRRQFLRGTLGGAAITVGLPLLDVFLNTNGTALAATGAPLPRRFGTWFFGCGVTPERWIPSSTGANWSLSPELAPISGVKDKMNVLSGYSVLLNGEANLVHHTGVIGALCGAPPQRHTPRGPTLEYLISRNIGRGTPFSALHLSPIPAQHRFYRYDCPSPHARSALTANDPIQLYAQLFGAQSPTGTRVSGLDTTALLDSSVLSAVSEARRRLQRQLGASDRNRLDEYCTHLRTLETHLATQLAAPVAPHKHKHKHKHKQNIDSTNAEQVAANHRTMARLAALALAGDQTRVVNMVFSAAHASLSLAGCALNHHQLTHSEPVDRMLGYRPLVSEMVRRQMQAWTEFVEALDAIPEGDGTLLDNCLMMALSDTADAATHSVTGLPVMTAGTAGGRLRSGLHIDGAGCSISRIGLTLQRAMGLEVAHWGSAQNWTNEPVSALLV